MESSYESKKVSGRFPDENGSSSDGHSEGGGGDHDSDSGG